MSLLSAAVQLPFEDACYTSTATTVLAGAFMIPTSALASRLGAVKAIFWTSYSYMRTTLYRHALESATIPASDYQGRLWGR